MNEDICTDTDQLPGSQREREREEGEGKKQGTAKYWDPVAKRAVTACRDLRPIIFEDSGLCILWGC